MNMDRSYWLKQTEEASLFPDIEWSRPENQQLAGKLLIIGGNLYGFAAPAEAYGESLQAGIGVAHALLPDCLKKYVGMIIEHATFAPSTPSGSFSQKALAEWLEQTAWADGILFAGDLGRNSETAILMERFLQKTSQMVTLTRDAADYAIGVPQTIIDRPRSLVVVSLAQLQRLAINSHFDQPVTFGMDMLHLVDWLHGFTNQHALAVVTLHLGTIYVAVGGRVSTTSLKLSSAKQPTNWRLKVASHCAVNWLQNPSKPFEALTSSILISGRELSK